MAGSAPDPEAGGGHGWDLGRRGKGVERWGKIWRFEEGVVARAAAGEAKARPRSTTLRVSELPAVWCAARTMDGIARSARVGRRIGRWSCINRGSASGCLRLFYGWFPCLALERHTV
jgi:hypothetical protein